ncbi:3-keto-disaccharide hydrolase [Haloferula sp.]|uniref:3-keto-disaccharide hydrolase n=1 Tax=Haloferula sp. TaxID=2497595 RepID=UPI00329AC734
MTLPASFLVVFSLCLPLVADEGFVPIFNGKDLSGWQSIREGNEEGSGSFAVDPEEKAMHVYAGEKDGSKQPIDCLYTTKEYSNYILKLEYKWLERRFPPRADHDRDAGLLFHLHGNLEKLWPNCLEMQLGESDAEKTKNRYLTGDLWVIGKDIQVMNNREGRFFYKPGAPLISVGKDKSYDSSYTTINAEKPHGEWNEITLTVRGGDEAIFELNGKEVNRISAMTYMVDGERVSLAKGRIGLQAEYAELLYRNILIKELPAPKPPAK